MRQIKFRAYDKKSNRMIEPSRNFLIETYDGLPVWQFGYDEPKPMEQSEIELMQFTGLTDKNGKEIYEGDIVKTGNGRVWTVQFGKFTYTEPKKKATGYGFYIQPIEEELKEEGNAYLSEGVEVIGNVYEHSHLIK